MPWLRWHEPAAGQCCPERAGGRDSRVTRGSSPALSSALPRAREDPSLQTLSCTLEGTGTRKRKGENRGEELTEAGPRGPGRGRGGLRCFSCCSRLELPGLPPPPPPGGRGRAGGVGDSPGADICRLPS